MKKFIAPFLLSLSFSALAVTSPTSLKIKIYQISASLNVDCSSPQVLFTSAAGAEKEMLGSPTLGNGNLANGTYNCIMFTMDDVIKFTPTAADGGSCVAGTEYSIDLCRDQVSSGGDAFWSHTDLLEGTTVTDTECAGTAQSVAAGGIANKVTLYLRVGAPANGTADADEVTSWKAGTVLANANGAGTPSVDSLNGIELTAPFVVSGTKSGIFYIDATNQVTGAGANCELNPPEFGFRE